jgi:hypothetical protein
MTRTEGMETVVLAEQIDDDLTWYITATAEPDGQVITTLRRERGGVPVRWWLRQFRSHLWLCQPSVAHRGGVNRPNLWLG